MLETIEGLYRYEKRAGFEAARESLCARLPVFERLSEMDGLDLRLVTEIQHHHAKALKILGMEAEAQAMFEACSPVRICSMRADYSWRASTAGQRTPSKKAAEQADAILTAASNPGEVSSNVVLTTLQALSSAGEAGARRSSIATPISSSARSWSLRKPVPTTHSMPLAVAARHWSWHDRDRLLRVFAGIEMIDPASLEDGTRTACGELFAEVAKGPDGVDRPLPYQGRFIDLISFIFVLFLAASPGVLPNLAREESPPCAPLRRSPRARMSALRHAAATPPCRRGRRCRDRRGA